MLRERKKKERKMKGRRLKRRREIGKRENCEEREKRKEYLIKSVFRFEYFGAWVFVGVFLGGAAVGGCFGGAVVGCRCCWWLQVMHCQWWVAVAVGDCRCRGFGVTMLGLVEYPDLGRQN